MKYSLSVVLSVLTASVVAQDTIQWQHAADGALPAAAANDDRPTILYFTFDT